jgi:hypothetical protein
MAKVGGSIRCDMFAPFYQPDSNSRFFDRLEILIYDTYYRYSLCNAVGSGSRLYITLHTMFLSFRPAGGTKIRMARPTRIDFPGAWYHVLNRGIEKRSIFRSQRCYERFLELLSALPGRFGVKLHGYVLMPNQRCAHETENKDGKERNLLVDDSANLGQQG